MRNVEVLSNEFRLKFENVCFFHEGQDPILKNADFEFPTNQVCWVKSEEGEGKSTLLQLLAALVLPRIGDYYINDQSVKEMTFEEFLPIRLKIGYSFDYGGLISNQTLKENLLLPLLYHKILPRKEAFQKVEGFIEKFDFVKFSNERPAHVPGRLRKLTCLLRALIHDPQLLILDDPFVGLGNETSVKLIQYIQQLRLNGIAQSLFLSTYDEKLVSMLNPEILNIDGGQIYQTVLTAEKSVANL